MRKKPYNRLIWWLYTRKEKHRIRLPFYLKLGPYRLCIYAMNTDWESMRIKVEKDYRIVWVLKEGVY